MIFIMSSSMFQDYINETDDNEILKATYIIVSSRIRRSSHKYENIYIGSQTLYPWDSVMQMIDVSDMEARYINQLHEKNNYIILMNAVRESILHESTIIFICSDIEYKNLPYMKIIKKVIEEDFEYPVPIYKKWRKKREPVLFDRRDVLQKVNKALKEFEREKFIEQHTTHKGKARLNKSISEYSKKKLKAELKKRNLYTPDMTKEEMIETLQDFS